MYRQLDGKTYFHINGLNQWKNLQKKKKKNKQRRNKERKLKRKFGRPLDMVKDGRE